MQRFHGQDDYNKHNHNYNHNLLALTATTSSQLSRALTLWSGKPTTLLAILLLSTLQTTLLQRHEDRTQSYTEGRHCSPMTTFTNTCGGVFPPVSYGFGGCFSFTSMRPYRLREGGISRELQHRRIRNLGYRVLFGQNHSIWLTLLTTATCVRQESLSTSYLFGLCAEQLDRHDTQDLPPGGLYPNKGQAGSVLVTTAAVK